MYKISILLILSLLGDFCFALDVDLTPTFFVGDMKMDFGRFPIGKNPTTFLINATDPQFEMKVSNIKENAIPVVIGAETSKIPFDMSSFNQILKTKTFGRNLIIGDRIPSVMNIAHDFGEVHGLMVMANEMTKTGGEQLVLERLLRGDLMIAVVVKMKNKSLSNFLPAHCALSMMKAILTTPGGDYSKLPIKFSWPVSLEWHNLDKKIGKVMLEKVENHEDIFVIGCGLRVTGDNPISISKMIDTFNLLNPDRKLEQLSLAPLIARTMNFMEEHLDLLKNDPKQFKDMIMDNWVNSDQMVKIDVNARVKGISEEGLMIFEDDIGFRGFLKPDSKRFKRGIIVT